MPDKKALIICHSYHHKNTLKIAKTLAKELNADIKKPSQIEPKELSKYNLIGFGSGIDSDRHYKPIYNLIEKLHKQKNKKAFSFCTAGAPIKVLGKNYFFNYTKKCNSFLDEKLRDKGFTILPSFACPGFNTNLFLKYFGGLNKNRPDEEDLKRAKEFAEKIKNH